MRGRDRSPALMTLAWPALSPSTGGEGREEEKDYLPHLAAVQQTEGRAASPMLVLLDPAHL